MTDNCPASPIKAEAESLIEEKVGGVSRLHSLQSPVTGTARGEYKCTTAKESHEPTT
jgi:hypothetical protein